MKTFKDIKKGDIIRWESGGLMTGLPVRIDEGKAQKFIKADRDELLVNVWMAGWEGVSIPVTPSSFRGFGRKVKTDDVRNCQVKR